MKNKHLYRMNNFIGLIAILVVDCFIVSSIAPDYEVRSLVGSDERVATRQPHTAKLLQENESVLRGKLIAASIPKAPFYL